MYGLIENTFGLSDGLARGLVFAISLAVVLALFALFVLIIKRLTGVQSPTSRNRQPRLAVMDAATIDTRRKLILVRRDNVEHLILIGGTTDLVVEQGIVKGAPVSAAHSRQQHLIQPIAVDTAQSESEAIKAALGAKAPSADDLETRAKAPASLRMRQDAESKEQSLSAAVAKPVATLASRLSRRPVAAATNSLDPLSPHTASPDGPKRDAPLQRERVGANTSTTGATKADTGRGSVPPPRATVSQRTRSTELSKVPTPAPRPTRDEGPQSTLAKNNRDPAADLATTLSQSLHTPSATIDQPPTKRNVTPPSSGPAAQAHTAFPPQLSTLRREPVVDAIAQKDANAVNRTKSSEGDLELSERTLERPSVKSETDDPASVTGYSEELQADAIKSPATTSNVQSISVAKKKQVTLSTPDVVSGIDDLTIFDDAVALEKPLVAENVQSISEPAKNAATADGDAKPPEVDNTAPAADASTEVNPEETRADDPIEDEMASLLEEINGPAKK